TAVDSPSWCARHYMSAFWNWSPAKRLLASPILATAYDGRFHRRRQEAARTQHRSSLSSRGSLGWTQRWSCPRTGGRITFALNRNQMNISPALLFLTQKTANKSGKNILRNNARPNSTKRRQRTALPNCRTQHWTI